MTLPPWMESHTEAIERWQKEDLWRAYCSASRDLSEAVKLLKDIEWGTECVCPLCVGFDPVMREGAPKRLLGHRPNCRLSALLAKYPETPP